jgi:hypothetical protein
MLARSAFMRNGRRIRRDPRLCNEATPMKSIRVVPAIPALALICLALPAHAADRMRAGQWVGSTVANGRTFASSSCVTQADADAMNGDAKAVRVVLEKAIPAGICKLSDIKANGAQIIYTTACNGATPSVITTTYHGDTFESTTTAGVTSTGKLTGPCK